MSTPWERRRPRSGATVSATLSGDSIAGGMTRAEILETPRRPFGDRHHLLIAFAPGAGAEEVPGREDRRGGQLHESSRSASLRRLSDETAALPAVSPTALTAAIRPVRRALLEPTSGT